MSGQPLADGTGPGLSPARSLGRALTNRVLLLSLIGVLGLAGTIGFSLLETLSRVQERLDHVDLEATGVFDRFFLNLQSDLRASSDGLVAQGDQKAALLALLMRNQALFDATLFAPDGRILAQRHSVGHRIQDPISYPSWLQAPPRFGQVEISAVMRQTEVQFVEMAVTATDDVSLPAGLLLVRVDLTALWDSALDIKAGESGHVYLVGDSGELIAVRNPRLSEGASNLTDLIGRSPTDLAAARMSLCTGLDHHLDLISAQRLRNVPWYAVVEEPAREALGPFMRQAMALTIAMLVVGILLASIIRFTRARIVAPLITLRNAVAGLAKGRALAPVSTAHNDELGQLAASFTHMSERMQQAFVDLEEKISALQSAQEALEQSESRIGSISRNFTAGMIYQVVIRPDGLRSFSFLSDSVRQLYGISPQQGLADASLVYRRIHEEDAGGLLAAEEKARTDGSVFRAEVRIREPDGGVRWSSLVSTPRRLDDGSTCWDGIEMIVTERKQAEEARDRLADQLRQREKIDAIGQLAAGIAHDFNNQLMGVVGYADLIGIKVADQQVIGYLGNIRTAVQRAAGLTAQLLAFGRMGKFQSVSTDAHAVIAEVVELLRRSIDKRIEIEARLAAEPFCVLGDPPQLQNALLNLGLNARDAMPAGGSLVFATSVVAIEESRPGEDLGAGDYLSIAVTDTGTGMDEPTMRRLFEPFFTTKEVGKGTGLGLASVYGTVKNHGGAIRVSSQPGQGSTFTILLPLFAEAGLPPAATAPSEAATPSTPSTPSMPSKPSVRPSDAAQSGPACIMVVDDEPLVLALCGALLRNLGYAVVACDSPPSALEVYRKQWASIDLVILDLVMPKIGGRDLFLALQDINPRIKTILSSGYSCNFEVQGILDAGATGFIQKPFELDVLSKKIAEILGR